jgi:hypothetical protein
VVERLAQLAVVGVLHGRQVARCLQRELAAAVGRRRRGLQHVAAGTPARRPAGLGQRVAVGGVEHVLAELLAQLGQRAWIARSAHGGALQFGAGQHEVAQRMVQRLRRGGRQAGRIGAGGDGLVLGVQALVGAQARCGRLGDAGRFSL